MVEPSALPGKVTSFPLEVGDVVLMETSGGGGFGDPLAREPARVLADVDEGYVSAEASETVYGVARDGGDAGAAGPRRERIHAGRVRVELEALTEPDTAAGRAIRLDAGTARQLGVGVGAVIELVNPNGAPLRAWITEIAGSEGRAAIAPIALRMLGVAEGAAVEIRAVHSGVLG